VRRDRACCQSDQGNHQFDDTLYRAIPVGVPSYLRNIFCGNNLRHHPAPWHNDSTYVSTVVLECKQPRKVPGTKFLAPGEETTMRSLKLSALCLTVTFLIASVSATDAPAQGFHYGGGGVHVDVGSPHRYYGNYGGYYGGFNGSLNQGYGYGNCGYNNYNTYYGGGWGGGQAYWHDTTHLDYHPAELIRHRGHYHYQPGHFDLHEEGHWD